MIYKLFGENRAKATRKCTTCIALCLFAVNCRAAPKDVSVETIEKVKHSIVPIVCASIEENKVKIVAIMGSGFFIDLSGRFITANHVLDDWEKIAQARQPCSPVIYLPDHGWGKFERKVKFQAFAFVGCRRDAVVDLAVCQPTENPFTDKRIPERKISPVAFDILEYPDGTPIAFTGFPLEYAFPITSKGYIAGRKAIKEMEANFDYIIDKSNWHGASGSLVYIETGKVIGIILAGGEGEGAGLGYARNAAAIVDFLSRNPASVNKKDAEQPDHPPAQLTPPPK
jgi:hypothetical protein